MDLLKPACRRKLEEAEGDPCRLVVSDLASDGPQSLYMYQRWLPLMLAVRGAAAFQHFYSAVLACCTASLKSYSQSTEGHARVVAMAAGSGPEYVLSVMPQSVKASAMPVQCASQLHYSLTPHSAITLTAVQPMLLVE